MKWLIIIFTIILYLQVDNFSMSAQTIEEIQSLANINEVNHEDMYKNVREYKNEYDLVFSKAFLFYKKFLSSQDASQCSFTPSCSVYAIHAIKTQGVFVGIINFFDRFSRCNSLSPEDYPKNYSNNTLIDPVRDIKYHIINE